MGLDWLDLKFRIEERYQREIHFDDLRPMFQSHAPPDITVGELYDYLVHLVPWCRACTYSLNGLGISGRCPECGLDFDIGAGQSVDWEGVRAVVGKVVNVALEEVGFESRLYHDLGMT